MSIPAHTNSFGPSYKEDDVASFFQYTDEPGPRNNSFTRLLAYNDKWPQTRGDGFSPNPYKRTIVVLEDEKPMLQHVPPGAIASYGWDRDYWISSEEKLLTGARFDNIDAQRSNIRSAARTKALLKLSDGKATLGVDLAEALTTANMLASDASTLARALLAFKRGNFKSIPALFGINRRDLLSGKFAADKWLQFQYGYKPLYGQIGQYADLLSGQLKKPLLLFGKSVQSATASQEFLRNRDRTLSRGNYSARWKTEYCAKVSNPYLRSFNEVGLLNPLSVAWELVPYSFVVDWFVPIGNVLEGISATAGLEFVWGFESDTTDFSFLEEAVIGNVTSAPGFVTQNAKRRIRGKLFERSVLSEFRLPELYAKANPFSTSHITSAVSLIRNLFR